jgi:long-chain fatty acid transport protein
MIEPCRGSNLLFSKQRAGRALIAAAAFLTSSVCAARAGAFLDAIQSASSASVSTAGQTAVAEDGSTVYYNPAGMSLLERPELLLAAGLVVMSNSFDNHGTLDALGNPVRGGEGKKDEVFPVPIIFATLPLSGGFTACVGIFSPFGQSNAYLDDWVGRYQLRRISLKTAEIDPAMAYRLDDKFAVGVGLDIQYAHLVRQNALDFGSLCFAAISPGVCQISGLTPQAADGTLAIAAHNWNVGFNLGAIYDLTGSTRIGISYRSTVGHDLSGHAAFQVPANAAPLTQGGLFQNTGLNSKITFPFQVNFGLSQVLDRRFTLLADIGLTGWSSVKSQTLHFANPIQPDQTLMLNWKDSVRVALGGIYHLSDNTDIRTGLSYDQTPVSTEFRSADLPDSDEYMTSAGIMERFDKGFFATIAYSYGYFTLAPADLSLAGAGTLRGTFHRRISAISVQGRMEF